MVRIDGSGNGDSLICVRDLDKKYLRGSEEIDVLQGLNLEVSQGEFVAFTGPSGSGKTTLLNVLAGLVPATDGSVTIRNRRPAAGRGDICYILARDALLPWRTVLGNVEYGLALSGVGRVERKRRASIYVEKVGLGQSRDVYPPQWSQGMRQGVSLARAFAVGRKIYLMDEPFSALDVQTRQMMEGNLLDLWTGSGTSVVLVTHDLDEAVALADEVVKSDVVITTAAVPGRRAPVLVTREMVEAMAPGAVVVDMAADSGGNCEVSERGQDVVVGGTLVVGMENPPSGMPTHASALYARNVANILALFVSEGSVAPNWEDEIVAGTCVLRDGKPVHPPTAELLSQPEGGT